jgi:hypothetical protein
MIYCAECGGRRVYVNAYIDLNTDEASDAGDGRVYCRDCPDWVNITEDRREAAAARLERIHAERVATAVYGPADPSDA